MERSVCSGTAPTLTASGITQPIGSRTPPAYAGAEAGEESTSDDAQHAAVPGFRLLRHLELPTVERISRDDYLRRWCTVSTFIVADEKTRERMLSDIETILDEHPDTQGAAHLELPKITDVFVYTRDESTRSVP